MAKTHIREALTTDFPTLLEIDQASFAPGIAYDSEELSHFMGQKDSRTVVAEIDGRIVAFLLMELQRKSRSATLITLDVRAECRRHGIGSVLIRRSEEILRQRGIAQYQLQVDVANAGAIEFYKRHGFEPLRILRRYYANGNDAHLMAKSL